MDTKKYQENKIIDELTLKISTARSVTMVNNWLGENVISPFSRLYYMKAGSGKIVVGDEELYLKPNTVYLVPVGLKFSHYPVGTMEKLYFHFNISRSDGYDMLRNVRTIKSFECEQAYIDDMYELFYSPKLIDTYVLKARMFADIARLIEGEGERIPDQRLYSEQINRAIKIITANPSLKIKTSDIAKELFISPSFLAKTFKYEVGITIGDYIDQMVLYSAQNALLETNDSISFISERLGFNDRYYFSKWFQKQTMETPSKYRKRHKTYS